MNWGGVCELCGEDLKQLWSTWYCDCGKVDSSGFGILATTLTEEYLEEYGAILPEGSVIYLFKDKNDAMEIVRAFQGFSILLVNLDGENDISWSSKEVINGHLVSGKLPFKVVK